MSWRFLKQPDGRYAVWSTVVDDFLAEDLTADQLREWYVGKKTVEAHDHITDRIAELDASGEISEYRIGPTTYDEAQTYYDRHHGGDDA